MVIKTSFSLFNAKKPKVTISDVVKLEKKLKREALETSLAHQIKAYGLPDPVREYKFCPTRKWRLDFYWEKYKLAVEVEGGVWTNGGHNRGAGFVNNLEKYNQLTMDGIKLLRFHCDTIKNGEAILLLEKFFKNYKGE